MPVGGCSCARLRCGRHFWRGGGDTLRGVAAKHSYSACGEQQVVSVFWVSEKTLALDSSVSKAMGLLCPSWLGQESLLMSFRS